MRVRFCGAIGGTVTVRKGETPQQALERAEQTILAALDRTCRLLGNVDGHGPNVGLELDDSRVEA